MKIRQEIDREKSMKRRSLSLEEKKINKIDKPLASLTEE